MPDIDLDALPAATPQIGDTVAVFRPGDALGAYAVKLTLNLPASGQFYADRGAAVNRAADRLLVGAAADNAGRADRDVQPRDWLSNVMGQAPNGAWATWGATSATISRYGTIAHLSASRTSDARNSAAMLGYTPASIGQMSVVINDDTAQPTTTTAWGTYVEAWRMPGVDYQPTFCTELQAINFGGPSYGASTPYHINTGGGTYCVQFGAGGGQATYTDAAGVTHTLADAECPWTVTANHARFRTGPVFAADSIAGTDGLDNGYAAAFLFGRNQALEWRTPEGQDGTAGVQGGAFIRSTVAQSANQCRQTFTDYGFELSNRDGRALWLSKTVADPTNIVRYEPGTGTQAAGFYAMGGTGGSQNLGLFCGDGGELQIASAAHTGSSPSGAPVLWLHVNVNGTDYRLPLYTPAQAGG